MRQILILCTYHSKLLSIFDNKYLLGTYYCYKTRKQTKIIGQMNLQKVINNILMHYKQDSTQFLFIQYFNY